MKRWSQHVADSKRASTRLANAIHAYGRAAFDIEHIASARCRDDLHDLEVMLIVQYGTRSPSGFNLTGGGERSPAAEPETRAKLSASRQGYKPTALARANQVAAQIGKKRPHSKNVSLMAAMNVARRGRKLSGTHLEKVQAAQLVTVATRIGIPMSQESRKKMSDAAKKRKASDVTRSKLAEIMRNRTRTADGRIA